MVFKDVVTKQWYTPAIKYVTAVKLMVGGTDGKFNPEARLIRAEISQALFRLDQLVDRKNSDSTSKATDLKENNWFYKGASNAVEKGYIDLRKDGFKPNEPITRGEMVLAIYRSLVCR